MNRFTGLYSKRINEAEAKTLFEPVVMDEIKVILTKFQKEKSPGPDGWTMEFFLTFFDLVGEDLVLMIEESRTKGSISGNLNATFLALIPKENKPI